MAENIQAILTREQPARIVVWAHNGHVATSGELVPMGAELRRALGEQVVVFGLAFDRGRFRAKDRDQAPLYPLREFDVGPSPTGSLEAMLASAGPPIFALDLRGLPASGPAAEWFDRPHHVRDIGANYSTGGEDPRTSPEVTRERYDALLFVEQTTPSRGIDAETPTQLVAAPENLDFEAEAVGVPPGWTAPTAMKLIDYEAATVACPRGGSGRCGTVRSTVSQRAPIAEYGTLMQYLAPTAYHGKRVRVRARVRADVHGARNKAYLFVLVPVPPRDAMFGTTSIARPITSAWKTETFELYVPRVAEALEIGLALVGDGQVWIDDVSLEIVEH